MRRLRAVLAGALLGVVLMASGSTPAQAHALLAASSPADGASVEQAPDEMLLTFTEAVDAVLSVVTLLDASGNSMDVGKPEAVGGQPRQLRVELGELGEGTYTVTWRTTSALDGHTSKGSLAFGVGVPAVAVGADGSQTAVRTPAPTPASVAGRWLLYVGVVLLLGAAVVGVVVVSNPAVISRRALGAAWTAAAAGVVLTILDQRASTRTDLANLISSSTGQKLVVQAVAVGLAGLAVAWACLRPSRSSLAVVGVAASIAMLARALAGHANASSVRWFTVGVQWIHLVSVGAWVGGLVWLLVAMRRRDPGQGRGLSRRFSAVAGTTLIVVAVSGTVRALDEVGAWAGLVDTTFGVTFLVKMGFFAALVALAGGSRFRHVPTASPGRLGGLRRAVRGEVALATGVLGVTAVLAGLPPSSSVAAVSKAGVPPGITVTGSDYATSVRVRLLATPGSTGTNRFDTTVEDYDSGDPVDASSVSLGFRLSERPDVAPPTLDLTRDADAHWRGTASGLSIAGRWTVIALVQTSTDTVEVPMELVIGAPAQPGPTGPIDESTCGRGEPNPSYAVRTETDPSPPKAEGTTFRLTVRRDGRPVMAAKVCIRVNMPEMQHRGVSTVAREASGGTYDARLRFSMTGGWSGTVTIVEPGDDPVAVAVSFEVT